MAPTLVKRSRISQGLCAALRPHRRARADRPQHRRLGRRTWSCPSCTFARPQESIRLADPSPHRTCAQRPIRGEVDTSHAAQCAIAVCVTRTSPLTTVTATLGRQVPCSCTLIKHHPLRQRVINSRRCGAVTFVFSGRMEFGACGTAPQSGVCEPSLDASGRIASGYSCLGGVKATPAPKAPTAKPRPPFPSTSKPGRETSTTAIVAAAAPALEPFRPRPRLCEPPPAGRVGTSGKISAASHKTAGGRLCLRPPPPPPPLSASPRSKAAASLRATEAAGDKLGARLVREEAEHAASAAADRGRAPDGPAGLTTTFM